MKCEEFEAVGLGLGREGGARNVNAVDAIERAAAIEHMNTCARCAALEESWQDARLELLALRDMTRDTGAPLRVEMRLRHEFHTRHRTAKVRRFAIVGTWVLASAAVLVVAMSWWNWHIVNENIPLQTWSSPAKNNAPTKTDSSATANNASTNRIAADGSQNDAANETTLVAANDAEDFTLLPGSLPQETGDGAVVRVRLQRGALGDLGLPVNEERASEWIQVDMLVGQDGQPQAVRLPQ
jgi:hypothetical protein